MFASATERNDQRIYSQESTWWSTEDDDLKPLRRLAPARAAFLSRQSEWKGQRVLDVGCGGGFMSEAIARLGAEVTGIDLAAGAIHAARAHAAREKLDIAYQVGSASSLPFENNQFDRIVCTDVLVHVPNPQEVIDEVARVLRPGGQFFFSAINRNPMAAFVMITLGEDLLGLVPKGTHDPETFIKPRELDTWMQAAGLERQSLEGLGPVGWHRGPTFGRHPSTWVMYQGLATNL